MPMREFQCSCGQLLELYIDHGKDLPRRCGFRCALGEEESPDLRGFGELEPLLSGFGSTTMRSLKDKPTAKMAAECGLTVYENQGEGIFERVTGTGGPKIIKRDL